MHFVIAMFAALICLLAAVLFKEVFPKWFKAILTLLSSFTSGYALAILIRKIAILSKVFDKPDLWITTGICTAVMFVLIVVIVFLKNKKK